jgi:cyanophycinase
MPMPIFLHGGGANPEANSVTFGRFAAAATVEGRTKIMLVALADMDEDIAEYQKIFASCGVDLAEQSSFAASPQNPLTLSVLAEYKPTAVFVCGGLTPAYQEALCSDLSWLDYLHERQTPFGGASAGAAIAAQKAIVGGWRVARGQTITQMIYQGAGENLDLLDVRSGLGLVSFSVDVHASQWGTISRLLHTVDTGLTSEGWAIDENTMLEVHTNDISIYGLGHAYHVTRGGDSKVEIQIFTNGQHFARVEP